MSSVANSDFSNSTSSGSKSKKSKKKKGAGKAKLAIEEIKPNGVGLDIENEVDEAEAGKLEPEISVEAAKTFDHNEISHDPENSENASASVDGFSNKTNGTTAVEETAQMSQNPITRRKSEDHGSAVGSGSPYETTPRRSFEPIFPTDTEARLDAMAKEREALRDEVAELRRSLEIIQEKHDEELKRVRDQLEERTGEKEHAESQYRNLLGKVNTIRSQLGERLKADAEDLSQAKTQIEDLEEQCETLRGQNEARTTELAAMAEEMEQRSKELSTLRNRNTLSQQNWAKEREDLIGKEAFAREEFEAAKQAMQDWEILAMEERSIRESASEKVSDLEEQLFAQREAYEKVASERDSQSLTVDGLQRALQEIQDARKRELREIVENSQSQAESLRKELHDAQGESSMATKTLDHTKRELERVLPFEKEVKEKNLLIGKLRHEAVILNDHLTKALRYLKKGKPEDNIDKQLVTNHFLHFLALERADPKKFQVLQIIAALLGWSDEQREQAGLARPGASNPNLKVPTSPWHRTPSTPALSTNFSFDNANKKESLADLWSGFLQQEAQDGVKSPKSSDGSTPPTILGNSSDPAGLGISPNP